MKKFSAIEGLRGWLAWIVVLSHLALTSNIWAKGLGPIVVRLGNIAVLVFVIISGFVITHLVTERPESYGRYLLRRFMRVFPLFAITSVIGFYTSDIYAITLSHVPWASDPKFLKDLEFFKGIAHSDHEFFWLHMFAHFSMLHGTISNALLPFSEFAFNPPAWSLSLEWQFYLVAPIVIMLARQLRIVVWVALAISAIELAYQFGLLGSFGLPSFLPGAAGYFALGIASRLAYPHMVGSIRHPSIIFALFLLLIPLGIDAIPILAWTLVMTGLVLKYSDGDAGLFTQVYHHMLESRAVTYFGSRSYSVYLCHFPIVAICHAQWLSMFPKALKVATFFGVSAMVIPLTLIAAELLYRGIEKPGIALGSRLARRNEAVPVTP